MLLQVQRLRKYFPVKAKPGLWPAPSPLLHAVEDLSFQIAPGEAIGLVGESGSGKSTLAEMLAKLTKPTSGRILFEGRDITAMSEREFSKSRLRTRIQMVFQDANESWNPRFTAYDAIAHPVKRLHRLRGAALEEKVRSAAKMVAFPPELLGRFPHQLSGGQRARVGIARAIVVEPALLILDEPTSALDISIQAVILQLLERIRRELNITIILVSHDLNIVRLLCDRVMIMYLGCIVEDGPTERIFTSPCHPYTASLIDAIPDSKKRGRKLIRLSGEPQSPIDPDLGACRFWGRCPTGRSEVCATSAPLMQSLGENQSVACHFPRNS